MATTNHSTNAENRVEDFVDTSAEKVKGASRATQRKVEQLSQTLNGQMEEAGQYITKNPLKSVLIAAGAGVLFGLIMKR